MADVLIPVKISPDILAGIYREARGAFPAECCGWLSGPKDGGEATTIRACENAQASGTHPTEAQRGAETAYVITGSDLLSLNRSLESDMPARVTFPSQPNGRAYLSPTDREVATSPWGDGPAYPVQQLVVGIDDRRVVEAALFAWSDDESGFVQIATFDGADV